MNKKFFSYGLFKEGVRQTRIMGLVGLIIILVATLLIWLSNLVAIDPLEQTLYDFGPASVLLLQYIVFCPLMVLYLFRFLNRRDASDLYHTLPQTRECLHLSYFTAVMFWNGVTTLSTGVLTAALYTLTPGMALSVSSLASFLFNMLAVQLAIGANALFAMSITGTAFSNVSVAILVTFVPRLVITALSGMIESACVIVDMAEQYPFLNPSLNIAAGLPITAFRTVFNSSSNGSGDIDQCLSGTASGIYTFVLGVVVLAAAVWLLHHRKSETAGKSSPNRFLQGVYRVVFGSVMGLLPVYFVFMALSDLSSEAPSYWISLAALILFIGLIYFLFELITTKKAKNMLKAIPGFFLFLLIDGALLAMVFGMSNGILSYNPTVEEMESIYLCDTDQNYFAGKSEKVSITNENAKKIVITALQDTVRRVETNRVYRQGGYLYGDYANENFSGIKVKIEDKTGIQTRYLLISNYDYQILAEILEQQEEYKAGFYEIPTPETHTMVVNFARQGFQPSRTQVEQLHATMVEEIKAMPFDTWFSVANGTDMYSNFDSIFYLHTTVEEEGREYFIRYPITKENFPKTVDLYMAYYNEAHPTAIEDCIQAVQQQDMNLDVWVEYPKGLNIPSSSVSVALDILVHAKPFTAGSQDAIVSVLYRKIYESDFIVATFTVDQEWLEDYLATLPSEDHKVVG